jgi:hypothetical protein
MTFVRPAIFASTRAQLGRDDKGAFLKAFHGIGDKYARKIMMDAYHRESATPSLTIGGTRRSLTLSPRGTPKTGQSGTPENRPVNQRI